MQMVASESIKRVAGAVILLSCDRSPEGSHSDRSKSTTGLLETSTARAGDRRIARARQVHRRAMYRCHIFTCFAGLAVAATPRLDPAPVRRIVVAGRTIIVESSLGWSLLISGSRN
jgi:hypothetical protein